MKHRKTVLLLAAFLTVGSLPTAGIALAEQASESVTQEEAGQGLAVQGQNEGAGSAGQGQNEGTGSAGQGQNEGTGPAGQGQNEGPTDGGQEQNASIQAANDLLSSGEPVEAVTSSEVHDALDQAVGSELEAVDEFGVLTPVGLTEAGAALNDAAADNALDSAELVTGLGDAIADAAADLSEGHADNAAGAAGAAADDADAAESAAGRASAALGNAQNAANANEAGAAAAEAQTASVEAQKAADDAYARAQNAAEEARNAENDYIIAKAAYDAAKEEADKQLAQGLINAEQAAAMTASAASAADAAYNAMSAARQAAEESLNEAKAKADAADEALQEKIDELEEKIAANAANVASKTGTAVLTGAALAAAKVAAEATRLEAGYYEGQIERRQESIEELNVKIEAAQAAIDQASEVVEQKKAALDKADRNYDEKAAELRQAEADLEAAQRLVDDLEMILQEREYAITAGIADALNAVRDGSATLEQIKSIASYVLSNASKYDPDAEDLIISGWDEETEGVFFTEDEEGNKTYYRAVVREVTDDNGEVTDRFLQFVSYTPAHEELLTGLPANNDEVWNAGTQVSSDLLSTTRSTNMVAKEGDASYQIVLNRTNLLSNYTYQIAVGSNTYELKKDKDGFYYEVRKSLIPLRYERHPVTVTAFTPEAIGSETGSSSAVTGAWADADNAEEILRQKVEAVEEAGRGAKTAANEQIAAAEALETAAKALDELENQQGADRQTVETLREEVKELDRQLNGALSEQLVVAFLDGGMDTVNAAVIENIGPVLGEEVQQHYSDIQDELTDLREQLKTANALQSISILANIARLEAEALIIRGSVLTNAELDLEQIQEQGSALAEVLRAASDGNINLDDVEAVVNLLANAGLSVRTREYIVGKITDVLEGVHHNAVEDLKQAVETGIEEIGAAAEDVLSAGADAAEAHAIVAVAEGARALAAALEEDAAKKKTIADKAAEDAANAAALYAELMKSYGPDDENVQRARDAADSAAESAVLAGEEAERAQKAADQAKKDYESARGIADQMQTDEGNVEDPNGSGNAEYPSQEGGSGSGNAEDPSQEGGSGSGNAEDPSQEGENGSGNTEGKEAADPGQENTGSQNPADNTLFYRVLGMTIAEYAASLRGTRYADLADNDPERLNSTAFVDHVYSHFNYFLQLDGGTLDAAAANGTLVSNDSREPGDLMVITDESGQVTGFGVVFDQDVFVTFSQETGVVEMAETAALNGSYGIVRIV